MTSLSRRLSLHDVSVIRVPHRDGNGELTEKILTSFTEENITCAIDKVAASSVEYLQKSDLLSRIALASPSFADRLTKCLQSGRLDEKLLRAVWRYWGRASTRPTPFGGFAGYCIASNDGLPQFTNLGGITERFHVLPDAKERARADSEASSTATLFYVNPYLYSAFGRFRQYERMNWSKSSSQILSEVDCDATLFQFLLELPRRFDIDIFQKCLRNRELVEHGAEAQAFSELVSQNIIWPFVRRQEPQRREVKSIHGVGDYGNAVKVDLEFKGSIKLPAAATKEIEDGLNWIVPLFGAESASEDLAQFEQQLYRKFSGEPVPLLAALDSDWAGYSRWGDETKQLLSLASSRRERKNASGDGSLSTALLDWKPGQDSVFEVPESVLQSARVSRTHHAWSSAWILYTNVTFSAGSDSVWLHGIGGGNGAELVGRFIGQNRELDSVIRDLVELDERVNADAICAEVMVSPRSDLDNVLPGRSPYFHTIALDGRSESDSAREIELRQLFVQSTTAGLKLTLGPGGRSVIPRFTSALVHSRSGSPVHRFLADFSRRRSITPVDFWRSVGVGARWLPRAVTNGFILSPERWRLGPSDFELARSAKTRSQRWRLIEKVLDENHLPPVFGVHEFDNVLAFDRGCAMSMLELEARILKRQVLSVSEYPWLQRHSSIGRDGSRVAHEIVSFIKQDASKGGVALRSNGITEGWAVEPSSEWMYFTISLRSGAEPLLWKKASYLLTDRRWFFVRYSDPSPHLRLRVAREGGKTDDSVIVGINNLISEGIVTQCSQEVYFPETNRYGGPQGMRLAHGVAEAGSAFASRLFAGDAKGEVEQLYAACTSALVIMAGMFMGDDGRCAGLIKTQCRMFVGEFELDIGEVSRSLGDLCGETERAIKSCRRFNEERPLRSLSQAVKNCMSEFRGAEGPSFDVAASIVHMHFNRMFIDNQRKYELLSWVLLSRLSRSPRFRAVVSAAVGACDSGEASGRQ